MGERQKYGIGLCSNEQASQMVPDHFVDATKMVLQRPNPQLPQYHHRSIQHSQLIQQTLHPIPKHRSIWQWRTTTNRITDSLRINLDKRLVCLQYVAFQGDIFLESMQKVTHVNAHTGCIIGIIALKIFSCWLQGCKIP